MIMHKKLLHTKQRLATAHHRRVRKLKLLGHHPVMVPIATFGALVLLTVLGFLLFGRNHVAATGALIVTISHDHVEQTVPTREPTVGDLLHKLDIPVRPGDVVEPSMDAPINQDGFRINVYRGVPVELIDGGQTSYTFSAAQTPRSIAKQAGTTVFPEDNLSILPSTNFLHDGAIGERVVINRATPVHVNLYGTQVEMRTHAKTVADLLKEKDIKLGKGDSVQPKLTSEIRKGQQIFILRKGIKIISAKQDVPMSVRTIKDPSLALGTSAVRQQGSPGKKIVTYQIQLRNGKEAGRKVIQSVLVQPPVTQIMVVGTKQTNSSNAEVLYKLRMCETHGNYQTNTGNGYSGAYQFSQSTWDSLGTGYATPYSAPPEVQDKAALQVASRSSFWSQFPACSASQNLPQHPY